jgi:hypothetical protein
MASLLDERRLIMRVYGAWKALAANGFPKPSDIDPASLGNDWANCLMVELDPLLVRSRFSHVGENLRAASAFDGSCISDCRQGSLLDLVTRRIPQVTLKKAPLGFGGSTPQDDGDLLYRTVLVPLSRDGDRIDSVLGAIAFRIVPVAPEAPISDIAWCNRVLAERLED